MQLENNLWARIWPCNMQKVASHCKARGKWSLGSPGFSANWGDLVSVSQGKAARVTDREGLGRAGAWALLLSPGDVQMCNA